MKIWQGGRFLNSVVVSCKTKRHQIVKTVRWRFIVSK